MNNLSIGNNPCLSQMAKQNQGNLLLNNLCTFSEYPAHPKNVQDIFLPLPAYAVMPGVEN
jgi:hypothetical protein